MASTQLITDTKSVLSNGPSAATTAKAIAAAGPIMDYTGQVNGLLTMLEEANRNATNLLTDTDQSTDAANYTLISNILASLS